MTPLAGRGTAISLAVVDGPYDAYSLSSVLTRPVADLGQSQCGSDPKGGCDHGTFIIGLLGARADASVPGICPDCKLLHVPLFADQDSPLASTIELAEAILAAIKAGSSIINLSLAIEGSDNYGCRELSMALDQAMASDVLVLAALGNESRVASGGLLSHPVTIPVVAVDAARRPLFASDFGPAVILRGIAALGSNILGYAPGGAMTTMSGTSVATAVASGTIAELWSRRPNATGSEVRAAILGLRPRDGPIPPILDPVAILALLDQFNTENIIIGRAIEDDHVSFLARYGGTSMNNANNNMNAANRVGERVSPQERTVGPASGSQSCSCGAPNGGCTCSKAGSSPQRFVYVLGSLDIRFPDQSIADELQAVANQKRLKLGSTLPLRLWYSKVLEGQEGRYVARLVSWILKVEGYPAYYLTLPDMADLDTLIKCLGQPEDDLDLVVGYSSLVPTELCPGVSAPTLAVNRVSSFDKGMLKGWLKAKTKATGPETTSGDAERLFQILVQSADNFGDTDQWRALNFLAVRYKPLYERYAEMVENGYVLDSVKVSNSRLWREKQVVDPVFTFIDTKTGVARKYFVRLDVSYLFPLVATHITEYFDR